MSTISVPLETERFLRLASFLEEAGSKRDPVTVIGEAIDYWLENAEWKLDALVPDAKVDDVARGYVWKIQRTAKNAASSLFLPSGTALRIRVGRQFEYATVEGDSLIYKGEPASPNQFARWATGSARDAWRDLWVKRPSDHDYQHADALRRERLTSKS
jgi:hypothetical protein